MPTNSREYQREYQRKHRAKTKATRPVVSVSMTADDHRELSRFAKAQGMSLSAMLREASLQQSRMAQLQSPQLVEELKELRFLVANIANNMNQMAHHSNRVKHVVDENGVLERFMELDQLIRDFSNSRSEN